jgi:hypothetical protein
MQASKTVGALTGLLVRVPIKRGAKSASLARTGSTEQSLTAHDSRTSNGSTHLGLSEKGSPASTETYSMRQAPSSGLT